MARTVMPASRILHAGRMAALRAGIGNVDLLCYLLRREGWLSFERIMDELNLPSRVRVIAGINRISIGLLRSERDIVRAVRRAMEELDDEFGEELR